VLINNIFQKVESKKRYSLSLNLRNQEEREIKVELLIKNYMRSLEDKIKQVNKSGKLKIQEFSEFFMNLCNSKILDVSKSNFIQYIPLFVVLRAKRLFEAVDLSK